MKHLLLLCFSFLSFSLYGQELQLDTLTVKKGYEFENNHRLYLAYQFICPTGKTVPLTKIREQVIADFFSSKNNASAPLSATKKAYEQAIINEVAGQSDAEKGNLTSNNYNEQHSAIRVVNKKVLVYMIQYYWYRGGTHGVEPCAITNYNLQTGSKITVDDLFSEDSKPAILEKVKQKAVEVLGYEPDSEPWLTDNFMLLPRGIQFRFNPYQIASYGKGRIDITLSYSEFHHLLKPQSTQYFTNN